MRRTPEHDAWDASPFSSLFFTPTQLPPSLIRRLLENESQTRTLIALLQEYAHRRMTVVQSFNPADLQVALSPTIRADTRALYDPQIEVGSLAGEIPNGTLVADEWHRQIAQVPIRAGFIAWSTAPLQANGTWTTDGKLRTQGLRVAQQRRNPAPSKEELWGLLMTATEIARAKWLLWQPEVLPLPDPNEPLLDLIRHPLCPQSIILSNLEVVPGSGALTLQLRVVWQDEADCMTNNTRHLLRVLSCVSNLHRDLRTWVQGTRHDPTIEFRIHDRGAVHVTWPVPTPPENLPHGSHVTSVTERIGALQTTRYFLRMRHKLKFSSVADAWEALVRAEIVPPAGLTDRFQAHPTAQVYRRNPGTFEECVRLAWMCGAEFTEKDPLSLDTFQPRSSYHMTLASGWVEDWAEQHQSAHIPNDPGRYRTAYWERPSQQRIWVCSPVEERIPPTSGYWSRGERSLARDPDGRLTELGYEATWNPIFRTRNGTTRVSKAIPRILYHVPVSTEEKS
jgi:hypothetical protein